MHNIELAYEKRPSLAACLVAGFFLLGILAFFLAIELGFIDVLPQWLMRIVHRTVYYWVGLVLGCLALLALPFAIIKSIWAEQWIALGSEAFIHPRLFSLKGHRIVRYADIHEVEFVEAVQQLQVRYKGGSYPIMPLDFPSEDEYSNFCERLLDKVEQAAPPGGRPAEKPPRVLLWGVLGGLLFVVGAAMIVMSLAYRVGSTATDLIGCVGLVGGIALLCQAKVQRDEWKKKINAPARRASLGAARQTVREGDSPWNS